MGKLIAGGFVSASGTASLRRFDHSGLTFTPDLTIMTGRYVRALSVTSDGTYLAVLHRDYNGAAAEDPRLSIFKYNGSTYTELLNVVTGSHINGDVVIGNGGKHVYFIESNSATTLKGYINNGDDTYSALANVTVSLTRGLSMSALGELFLATATDPIRRVNVDGSLTPITVSGAVTPSGRSAFSKRGRYAAISKTAGGAVNHAYVANADFSQYTSEHSYDEPTGTNPTSAVDETETYFAYSYNDSIRIFKRVGSVYTQVHNSSAPTTNILEILFTRDSNYLFLCDTDETIHIYSRAGDVFTYEGVQNLGGVHGVASIGYFGDATSHVGRVGPTLDTPTIEIGTANLINFTGPAPAIDFDSLNINIFMSQAMQASDSNLASLVLNAYTEVVNADSITGDHIWVLIQAMTTSLSVSAQTTMTESVLDALETGDLAQVILNLFLTDAGTLTDTATGDAYKILTAIDVVLASDSSQTLLTAINTVAAVMAASDQIYTGIDETITQGMTGEDTAAARLTAAQQLVASVVASELVQDTLIVVRTLTDGAILSESLVAQMTMQAPLADDLIAEELVLVNGLPMMAWVMNTTNLANSQYTNFSFNSMTKLGGRYYGAGYDGLFLLEGDTDDGDEIQGSVKTGLLDFGSPMMKRVEFAHIGYTSSGEVVMRVTTTQDGERKERWYKAKTTTAGSDREGRFKLGAGVKSKYWQFEWVNVDGADFDIDRIDFTGIIQLSRGV